MCYFNQLNLFLKDGSTEIYMMPINASISIDDTIRSVEHAKSEQSHSLQGVLSMDAKQVLFQWTSNSMTRAMRTTAHLRAATTKHKQINENVISTHSYADNSQTLRTHLNKVAGSIYPNPCLPTGFTHATCLDASMQCCCTLLDKDSQETCSIIVP